MMYLALFILRMASLQFTKVVSLHFYKFVYGVIDVSINIFLFE